ncbi:MAG: hypothetical protein B7Z79_12040 [Thiomonas sp. 20-64-9]|nr:MAG: hypothetical protein B7Z79_12040 [Thiomonas sp. 20-64-9]
MQFPAWPALRPGLQKTHHRHTRADGCCQGRYRLKRIDHISLALLTAARHDLGADRQPGLRRPAAHRQPDAIDLDPLQLSAGRLDFAAQQERRTVSRRRSREQSQPHRLPMPRALIERADAHLAAHLQAR